MFHLCAEMGFPGLFKVLVNVVVGFAITFTLAEASADCNVTSETGIYLNGHVYASFPVQDVQQCYEKCKADEPKCRSLNYHGDQTRCELNNATRSLNPDDIMENPLSIYFESRYRGKSQHWNIPA